MQLNFEITESVNDPEKQWVKNTPISEGVFMVEIHNAADHKLGLKREIDQSLIQFYLAGQGGADFLFSGGSYRLQLQEDNVLLFYNPLQALPLDLEVKPHSRLAFLYITVERLHQLFVKESQEIAFLNQENINKKFYADRPMEPALKVTVNQLLHHSIHGPSRQVYQQAKVFEFFALFFQVEEEGDVEQCPFLKDEENVQKIRQAKQVLIEEMTNPPTLKELARKVGLNEYRLKAGFKNIYGKTVFQFLNDYRLEKAREILNEGQAKVNDAAYQIGYNNPSHFIAAFRKKYGVTPKKYLMQSH